MKPLAMHKATDGAVVVIDLKTVRGSVDRKNEFDPIHMLSASCTTNSVVRAHTKTDYNCPQLVKERKNLQKWNSTKNKVSTDYLELVPGGSPRPTAEVNGA